MVKQFAKLQRIDNNEAITEEKYSEFVYHLQLALLLAFREKGQLNAMQYRYAEDQLKQQRRRRASQVLQEGTR